MTPRELYAACAEKVRSYPAGKMHPLPPDFPVSTCGFFPVCSGSFHEPSLDAEIGERSIMFVGQDWGGVKALPELLKNPVDIGTGRILTALLASDEVKIPLQQCFFTNALFGVRDGKGSVGWSKGWSSPEYVAECVEALRLQVDTLKPKVIVCLGLASPGVVGKIYDECKQWTPSFKRIDENENAVLPLRDGRLGAILVHPSYRHLNAKRRKFASLNGLDAELAILRRVSEHASRPAG